MKTIYMSDNFQFGAPLGWVPRSGITWNGYFLPYHLRISDMLQAYELETDESAIAAAREVAEKVIQLDIYTGETREWNSYAEVSEHYNFTDLVRRQDTGSLVASRLYFYKANDPPSEEKLQQVRDQVAIRHAFGR